MFIKQVNKKFFAAIMAMLMLITNFLTPIHVLGELTVNIKTSDEKLDQDKLELIGVELEDQVFALQEDKTSGLLPNKQIEQNEQEEITVSNIEVNELEDTNIEENSSQELFTLNNQRNQRGEHYNEADPNQEYLLFEIFVDARFNYNFGNISLRSPVPEYFDVTKATITNANGSFNMNFSYGSGHIRFNSPGSTAHQGGTVRIYGKLDPVKYINYIENGLLGSNLNVNYQVSYTSIEEQCIWDWVIDQINCTRATYTTDDAILAPTFELHEVVIYHETSEGETVFPTTTIYGLLGLPYETTAESSIEWVHIDTRGNATGTFNRQSGEVTFIYESQLPVVEVIEQVVSLGTDLNLRDPRNFVDTVKFGDLILESEDFDVKTESINVDTNIISPREVEDGIVLEVTLHEFDVSTTVNVPVTVVWGSSIQMVSNMHWMVTGLSLVQEQLDWRIYGTEGTGVSAQREIHSRWSGRQYMGISLFRPTREFVINENNPHYSDSWTGDEQVFSVNERFNGELGYQPVALGDIIKIEHEELQITDMVVVHQDGDGGRGIRGYSKDFIHFEITEFGYRELTFDRVVPRVGGISTETTNEELNELIEEYLDMSQVSDDVEIVGFEMYPNREQSGAATGVIRIQEYLVSTGNWVQKDYEVIFEVEQAPWRGLRLTVPETLQFETTTIQSGMNFIERKQKRDDEPWGILVEDTRLDKSPWSLRVTANPLTSDLVNLEGEPHRMYGALVFKKGDGFEPIPLSEDDGLPIYESGVEGKEENLIFWEDDEGILLWMNPTDARATTYRTTITWTLFSGPDAQGPAGE